MSSLPREKLSRTSLTRLCRLLTRTRFGVELRPLNTKLRAILPLKSVKVAQRCLSTAVTRLKPLSMATRADLHLVLRRQFLSRPLRRVVIVLKEISFDLALRNSLRALISTTLIITLLCNWQIQFASQPCRLKCIRLRTRLAPRRASSLRRPQQRQMVRQMTTIRKIHAERPRADRARLPIQIRRAFKSPRAGRTLTKHLN